MVKIVQVFECSLCENEYFSELEARECFDACKRDLVFENRTSNSFLCEKCGAVFHSNKAAQTHESVCERSGDNVADNAKNCQFCAHMDVEKHRWSPCLLNHFAPIRPACEQFTLAEK